MYFYDCNLLDNVDVLADNNMTIGGQVDDTNQMSNGGHFPNYLFSFTY
jgi:hypothetical protein